MGKSATLCCFERFWDLEKTVFVENYENHKAL